MVKICMEESFHQRQGFEIMVQLANGTKEQKEMAQDAVNRKILLFQRNKNAWKSKKLGNDLGQLASQLWWGWI